SLADATSGSRGGSWASEHALVGSPGVLGLPAVWRPAQNVPAPTTTIPTVPAPLTNVIDIPTLPIVASSPLMSRSSTDVTRATGRRSVLSLAHTADRITWERV